MKKKILTFLLALCMILPFSFVLSACGPNNPGDPPPEQGNGFELSDAITALNNLEPNFTNQITANYSMEYVQNQGATSTSQSQDQSLQNIVLRLDEKDFSLDIPSVISLAYKDGYLYVPQTQGSSYSNNLGVMVKEAEQVFGEDDLKLGDMLSKGVEVAQWLNKDAVTINEKETGTTVTVKFEIQQLVSKLQKLLVDYKDAKLGEFINKFVNEVLGIADFEIGEFADSVVEYITDATTFEDIIQLVTEEAGVDVEKIMSLLERFPFKTWMAGNHGQSYEQGEDRVDLFVWEDFSLDDYKELKVLETIGITKSQLVEEFPEIKEMYLNNTEVTFGQLLLDNTDEQTVNSMYQVLDTYSVGKFDIAVVLNFDTNKNLVGYQLKADAKVTEKVSALASNDYLVSGTVVATMANVGTTIVTMPTAFEPTASTITVITSRTMLALKNNTITLDDPYMKDFEIKIDLYDDELEDYATKTVATYTASTKKLVLDDFLLADKDVNEISFYDYQTKTLVIIYVK